MPELAQPAAEASARLGDWQARIDAALRAALDAHAPDSPRLRAAMRHAVLLGGKRMRPLLVYAAGTAFGAAPEALDAPAAAVEFIHAYSLVHDDLPAMDDDALRRGQPTVHVAFDEATAILAGDALQSLAFAVLAEAPAAPAPRLAMLAELAQAAGARGMCGGQALDLDATGGKTQGRRHTSREAAAEIRDHVPQDDSGSASADPVSALTALERLHAQKTGALLRAAVRLGAIAADADARARADLDRYADALGLAFQIRDDLLDVESDSTTLGKTAGKDAAQRKLTFPALIGVDASRRRLQALAATMREALGPFGARADALAALARRAIEREF